MAAVLPGCSFSPTEIELTDVYLRRKIAGGHDFPVEAAGFFHDADVYSAEPEKLVQPFLPAPGTGTSDKQPPVSWYFFSPARYAGKKKSSGRWSRTIDGDGSKNWHSEKMARPVEGGSAVGGCVQKLSYMVKDEASGKKSERAGWIMAEYGISPEHGGGSLVLCKVYPSTYSHKTAADSPGINLRKRKAAPGGVAPSTNVRPRIDAAAEETYGDLDAYDDVADNVKIYWDMLAQQAAQSTTAAYVPIVYERGTTDCFGIAEPDHQVFGFWQEMEQEFEASYPISNEEVVDSSGGYLATTPCALAAAQPEEDAAGLSDEDQNSGEDGALMTTQLDEAAADEVIYVLTSSLDPGFSPEMLERLLSE